MLGCRHQIADAGFKVRYAKNQPPPPASGKAGEDILFQPVHKILAGRRLQLAEMASRSLELVGGIRYPASRCDPISACPPGTSMVALFWTKLWLEEADDR